MFKKHLLGAVNLTIPFIVFYLISPVFIVSLQGRLVSALFFGIYLYYLNSKQAKNLTNSLKFSPSGVFKEVWKKELDHCQIPKGMVKLRYAYTAENIAMAVNQTVILDPLLWSSIQEDPEAQKVQDIFHNLIEAGLSERQKACLINIRAALSEPVQRFIFRHELAHVIHKFSRNKLRLIFLSGVIFSFIGLSVAVAFLPINGFLAIIAGMLVGGVMDLILVFVINYFFKLKQERQADIFALRFSTSEEINQVATFFEKHQEILDTYGEKNFFASYLPSTVLIGYPNGKKRAAWLRRLVSCS